MNLYNITQEMLSVIAQCNNPDLTQEETEKLQIMFDELNQNFDSKISQLVKHLRQTELRAQVCKLEEARIKELKQSYEKDAERTKKFIDLCMTRAGFERLDLDVAKFSYRESTSVTIEDQTKIPEQYLRTKVEITPDKDYIKQEINNGVEIPGAKLETKKNLQIK